MDIFKAAKSVSIIEIYEKYTGTTISTFRKKGNVSCPFHGEDHNPSMHLYTHNNTFYCFACGTSGSQIDFVQKIKGYDNPKDAAKDICETFDIQYEDNYVSDPAYELYTGIFNKMAKLFNFMLNSKECPNPRYFKERGFSDKLIEEYQLGYCPESLRFNKEKDLTYLQECGLSSSTGTCPLSDRYIFPIKDGRGNVIGFAGRSLHDRQYKYINTPETRFFQKRNVLFNYQEARKYSTVYVVEGFADALSLIDNGVPNVVALMGTSLTERHIGMLKGKNIVLALDSDDAGQKRTMDIIRDYKNIKFQVVPKLPRKDFNECFCNIQPDIVLDLLGRTVSAPEYVIHHLKNTLDLKTLQGRETLWRSVARLIGANDARYQEQYPLNLNYTPVALDYYWTIVKRIIKGRRTK